MRTCGAASTRAVPTPCSLYRAFDEHGRILYIGITAVGMRRMGKHLQESRWWPLACRFELLHLPSREEALAAEADAIRREQPIYNVCHAESAVCSECERRLRWVEMDTPQSVFVFEGRTYSGAWLCEYCQDYDPYVAPPVSAAFPPAVKEPMTAEARREMEHAALERVREAFAAVDHHTTRSPL